MSAISWKRYDDECHLSDVLTDAARACADAKATNPTEFLTSYFRSISKGDVVQELSCTPIFAICAENEGLCFALKLFTNIESATEAVPLNVSCSSSSVSPPPDGDAAVVGSREDQLLSLAAFVNGDLQKKLVPIGVHRLSDWDAVLHEARPDFLSAAAKTSSGVPTRAATPPSLPVALQHAISLAAATAAAKTISVPLYTALRSLYLSSPPYVLQPNAVRAMTTSGDAPFGAPQLVLPFLGCASPSWETGRPSRASSAASAANPANGGVYLDTLYLLPGPDANQGGDRKGVLEAGSDFLLPRLFQAYRALQARAIAVSGNSSGGASAVRRDGAVVMEDFDNLTDAVELATEVVQSVGLEPGTHVRFGLRIACPVVISPMFGQNQTTEDGTGAVVNSATAPGSDAVTAKEGGAKKSAPAASGKKNGGGGAGKQSVSQVEDIMYALFVGDADVTSSQLSAYVYQQVTACRGHVVLVQDVHAPEDVAGEQRLQALLGPSVCVSRRSAFEARSGAEYERLCQTMQSERWCADIGLTPTHMGTLTALFTAAAHAQRLRHSVSLCAPAGSPSASLSVLVDLALAVQARFLVLEGLISAGGAQSVTHCLRVLETLQQQRVLMDLPADSLYFPEGLPAVDISGVPEIKRKAEKKKRKGR